MIALEVRVTVAAVVAEVRMAASSGDDLRQFTELLCASVSLSL